MSGDIWLIATAVVLTVVAMFLVALESALTRVSKVSVSELQDLGVPGADRLAVVVGDRARYVNVILLVRLALSTFAIVCVTVVCLKAFPEPRWLGIVIASSVMLLVTFIMLGVAPRTLGRQHAIVIARRGSGVARVLNAVFGPLASLLILFGNAITPGKGYRHGPFASTAELREMVDMAEADAVIEAGEREMIHSVFELGDTLAREVMVPRIEMVWIEKEKRLRQALSLALRSGFSRIPVIGENLDDVVGIVYLKDLARRSFEHRDSDHSERVEKLMRPVMFVPDSKPADELMREMQATRTHVAIVIDEYGGTAGLITIEDILEEIVGEIADEYDEQEIAESEQLADSCWRVSARMQLDDFAELLDLNLSEESEGVETVAGLLASRLGVVPIPGSSIEVEGFRLVAEMSAGRRNRVGVVFVSPIETDDGEGWGPTDQESAPSSLGGPEELGVTKGEEVSK
ncbi:MAG: CBS domain containing-hemolysin-like protein [Actinomycetes bacterium]